MDAMTRRPVLSVFALAASAAVLVGVTACAPEGSAPAASHTATTSPTVSPTTSSPGASATSAPSPDASSAVSGAACLPGDWTMDQAGLDRFYTDINAATAGSGIALTPRGSAAISITPDGAYSWMPSAEVTAQAGGTAIVVTLGGRVDGTYTATDDTITSDSASTDGLEVGATLDGSPTDAGEITQQITASPLAGGSYTCSGDTLTLTTTVADGPATAVLRRG